MNISIIFVEPESEDNIGALARVMANFGFENLILVNPLVNPFSERTKIIAREKGWEIIKKCKIYADLFQVIPKFDINYGTTGVSAKRANEILRNPITPRELAKEIYKYNGNVGIYFGRESRGFTNEELNLFDSIITIPADENYPVMNITHAAAIVLYELFIYKDNPIRKRFGLITPHNRYVLYELFKEVIKKVPIQEYKKPVLYRGFKNIIGKAILSKREYSLLAGFLRSIKDILYEYRK